MRLAIVTADGPEHRFVAARLAALEADPPIEAAVFLCERTARRGWRAALRQDPSRFAGRAARRLWLRAGGDGARRAAALGRVLGPASRAWPPGLEVVPVGRPREGRLAAALAAHAPDVIAVYGTGIIPDEALRQTGTVALNMHTGLSPEYRGTACAFWPIHDGRPDMVGATVHECTSAVDGGRIFARGRAALRRGDDLHAVFARAVLAGADLYAEVVGRLARGEAPEGRPQDLSLGREYRGTDLTLGAERRARRQVRRLSPTWTEAEDA